MDHSKVTDKIKKLTALAERAGTEAEAMAAMSRIHALLAKHNLSMSEIDISDKEESFIRDSVMVKWNQPWIKITYQAIAKLYFCDVYIVPRGQNDHIIQIVGNPVNTETVKYVASVAVRTAISEARASAKTSYKNSVSVSNNFKKGFATRIAIRCKEEIQTAKTSGIKDPETGNSLVLADLYQSMEDRIKDYYSQSDLNLKSSTQKTTITDTASFKAGSSAANSVNLKAGGIGNQKSNAYLIGAK